MAGHGAGAHGDLGQDLRGHGAVHPHIAEYQDVLGEHPAGMLVGQHEHPGLAAYGLGGKGAHHGPEVLVLVRGGAAHHGVRMALGHRVDAEVHRPGHPFPGLGQVAGAAFLPAALQVDPGERLHQVRMRGDVHERAFGQGEGQAVGIQSGQLALGQLAHRRLRGQEHRADKPGEVAGGLDDAGVLGLGEDEGGLGLAVGQELLVERTFNIEHRHLGGRLARGTAPRHARQHCSKPGRDGRHKLGRTGTPIGPW